MMNFKVKFSNGASIQLKNLSDDFTLSDLKNRIEEEASIPTHEQHIMTGYPPTLIEGDENKSLLALGLRSGSVLTVSEAALQILKSTQKSSGSIFQRRVIPADNSCLFNSIGYALKKEKSGNGQMMRSLITKAILEDPDTYTAVFLGRPVDEYCSWIKNDKSWGGEIELSILSVSFKIEIVVFDVISMARLSYGEGQGFTQRIFLLYDGIHYDVIVESPSKSSSEANDITRFSINDFDKVQRASEVAVEAHQHHEYTNLSNFSIQCMICRKQFKGQQEAQCHAQDSGHQQFGEIKGST